MTRLSTDWCLTSILPISTMDYKQRAFVGDHVSDCKLWLFADADHARALMLAGTSREARRRKLGKRLWEVSICPPNEGHLDQPDSVPQNQMPTSNLPIPGDRWAPQVSAMSSANRTCHRREHCHRSSPPGGDGQDEGYPVLNEQGDFPSPQESPGVCPPSLFIKLGTGEASKQLRTGRRYGQEVREGRLQAWL